MTSVHPARGTRSERIYAAILRLYPPAFRLRFGDEMLLVFAQMLKDESAVRVWLRTMRELPGNLIKEHSSDFAGAVRGGRVPRFTMAAAVAGAVLLMPGLLLFAFGLFDSLILHDRSLLPALLGGFASNKQTMQVALIVLPIVAAAANGLPLAVHLKNYGMSLSYAAVRTSALNAMIVAVSLGLASFILFHDSLHCILQNPMTAASHPQQTIHCIRAG